MGKDNDKIIEAANLPENEKVYLVKDMFGWRIVNPIKNPVTGKIDWINLLIGGKRNAITLLVIFLVFIFLMLGISEIIEVTKYNCLHEVINGTNFIQIFP